MTTVNDRVKQLPKMLQYKTVKPKGFPAEFKRWELQPLASSSDYNLLDIIRFKFQTDWFFDPFQTYMDIEVEFPQDDQNMGTVQPDIVTVVGATSTTEFNNSLAILGSNPVNYPKKNISNIPVYSLDGPATSLIQEMILYSNGNEVERIQEYDVLGNLVADLGVPAAKRANKKFEGYHYPGQFANYNQFKYNKPQHYSFDTNGVQNDGGFQYFGSLSQTISHEDVNDSGDSLSNGSPNDIIGSASGKQRIIQTSFMTNYNVQKAYSDVTGIMNNRDTIARSIFRNYAREYVLSDGSMGVDHTKTRNSAPIHVNQTTDGLTTVDLTQQNTNGVKQNKRVVFNHESSINQFDYMCPGIQAIKYQNGIYQDVGVRGAAESNSATDVSNQQKLGIYKKVFHVPILSAVMGHLIPSDQWTLIPGKGCGEMTWEFRLNRYAFFASGHLDNQKPINAFNGVTDGVPAKQFNMNWKVTKMSIRFDLWRFDNSIHSVVDDLIKSEQCIMTTQGFTLGPITQLETTSQARGNFHINNGILSLKNIYVFYLLNDYQKYNYCAKNFRISHNLKSLQLKIGNEYIPKQAIIGNAGNLISNGLTDNDVYPFLMELYRSQGEMFNITNKCCVTPFNFCLNDRVYNPASRIETSCQQALLHEQRARGKAIYTIDMQADPFDCSVLTGFDTTLVRPIELLIDADINAGMQFRSSTMYVWLHHDTIVQFTPNGIKTIAYG